MAVNRNTLLLTGSDDAQGLSLMATMAEKHATEHNITPAALLSARLYPDMFPLTGQVRSACDTAQRSTAPSRFQPARHSA